MISKQTEKGKTKNKRWLYRIKEYYANALMLRIQ